MESRTHIQTPGEQIGKIIRCIKKCLECIKMKRVSRMPDPHDVRLKETDKEDGEGAGKQNE